MRKRIIALLVIALVGAFLSTAVAMAQTTKSVQVETIPGQSLNTIVKQRVEASWPWYLIRASGIVAGVSLVALLLSGIGSVTGHFFSFLEPLTAWATHRALGITFVAGVIIHMVTLLFDKFIPFTLMQILVPWTSSFRPVTIFGINLGSLYVALGIIAFYGAIVVLISSLMWVDKKPQQWKLIHYTSYLVVFAVFVHALFIGTDTSTGLGRTLWIIGGLAVLLAIAVRLRRARSI